MRVGKKIIIAVGGVAIIWVTSLISFNNFFSVNPSIKINKEILLDSNNGVPTDVVTNISSELTKVVGSLSSLEQELIEVDRSDLEKKIEEADAMIIKMDKLVSESNATIK